MPADASRAADDGPKRSGPTVDPAAFREVVGHFASGVAVVTTAEDGRLCGTTASAVASLSVEPPMMLVCLNQTSTTQAAVRRTNRYAVNILTAEQQELAHRFARKAPDKFAGVAHTVSEHGLPLIDQALATIECVVTEAVAGGTHTVFLGRVLTAAVGPGEPLAYFRGRFATLDHPGPVDVPGPCPDVVRRFTDCSAAGTRTA